MNMEDYDQWPKQWPEDWQPADLLRMDFDLETWVGVDPDLVDFSDLLASLEFNETGPWFEPDVTTPELANIDSLLRTFDDTFLDGFDPEAP